MKQTRKIQKMIYAAFFLALAFVLPFFTGQNKELGSMLCLMHLPVLLCGFLLGPIWGGVVGFTAPLLRSLTLTMPQMYPTALCMAFELCAYGLVSGLVYRLLSKKRFRIFPSLLLAMVAGRLVWGTAMLICIGINTFTFATFWSSAVAGAIPGILLQLVLIPPLVKACERFSLKS